MKSNMGTADRVVRVLVAVILAWAWYTGRISGTLAIVLLVIAGVFILTSFIGFCPGYLPFGLSTRGKSGSGKP
jgi:K+-transporting ATPase A subunit